jgi:uncharacterized protein YcbX
MTSTNPDFNRPPSRELVLPKTNRSASQICSSDALFSDRVHDLETDFDFESNTFHVVSPSGESRHFDLEAERERAARWFSSFFGVDLKFRRDTSLGFVDRLKRLLSGINNALRNSDRFKF